MAKTQNRYGGEFFIAGLYGAGALSVGALEIAKVIPFAPTFIALMATCTAVALFFLASIAIQHYAKKMSGNPKGIPLREI